MLKRNLLYPCEAFLLAAFFFAFRILPVGVASSVGGLLGRSVGPWLAVTRRARRNLLLVYPQATKSERTAIVREMWDNLGRTAAEVPHLRRMSQPDGPHVEFVGAAPILALAAKGEPVIMVGAHLANWELLSVFLSRAGFDLTSIARQMKNKRSQAVIESYRNQCGGVRIGKGRRAAQEAIGVLRRGGTLGILFDQKFNQGIPVPFLGHDAMTADAPAHLSLRFGCPIVPVRIERIRGAKFRITCLPPIELRNTGDRRADTNAITAHLNELLGGWIRDRPSQWFWVHKRWPDAAYRPAEALKPRAR